MGAAIMQVGGGALLACGVAAGGGGGGDGTCGTYVVSRASIGSATNAPGVEHGTA